MRIIVAGGRDFDDYKLLKEKLDLFFKELLEVTIVSGKQRSVDQFGNYYGADYLGEQYAKENNIPVDPYPADWSLGKKAGYLRNKLMAENADGLVAFWNGESRGTKHMIDLARENGLKVRIVKYERKNREVVEGINQDKK